MPSSSLSGKRTRAASVRDLNSVVYKHKRTHARRRKLKVATARGPVSGSTGRAEVGESFSAPTTP